MRPEHLQYAESLKSDLLTANQPFSAEVVARLLEERAELLAACEAAKAHVYNSPFEGAITVYETIDAAITKARGA